MWKVGEHFRSTYADLKSHNESSVKALFQTMELISFSNLGKTRRVGVNPVQASLWLWTTNTSLSEPIVAQTLKLNFCHIFGPFQHVEVLQLKIMIRFIGYLDPK